MSEVVNINARSFPAFDVGGRRMVVLSVLVKRIEGTFKAYAAIVPDVSGTDPEFLSVRDFVKVNGSPLRFDEARAYWTIKPEVYAA